MLLTVLHIRKTKQMYLSTALDFPSLRFFEAKRDVCADDGTAGVHSGNMAEAGRLIRIDGSLGIYKENGDGWDVLDFAVRTRMR